MFACFKIKHWVSLFVLLGMFNITLAEEFTVRDIRVDGLKRVSEGLVISKLPVRIGQQVDDSDLQQIVQALHNQGYFSDIKIARDTGDVLVLQVVERASIRNVSVKGNKLLKSEPLLDGFSQAGIGEGKVYNPALLESLRQELVREYVAQGMYDANIKANVEEVGDNLVDIELVVSEKGIAKIKKIAFTGNQAYSDKELKQLMTLKDRKGLAFWSKKNRYLKDQLKQDLATVENFYRDNGYLKFRIDSVQVDVDQEQKGVVVNIAVNEGSAYRINNVRFLSQEIKDQATVDKSIDALRGEVYSQAKISAIEELIKRALGTQGFAFARVRGVPQFQEGTDTVDVVFAIENGKRSYVRRINFTGNTKTQDHVLRREMRQMESAPANTALIEQSKIRLQRLGFFKEVSVETVPVEGQEDQVDVNFKVVEEFSGSIGASIGFADGSGLQLGANLQQNNFMGTGNKVNIGINRSKYQESINLGITNPYYTKDGVSRGFNVYYRKTDLDEVNISSYNVDRLGANMTFGYPLSETQRLGFSVGYEQVGINTGDNVVQEIENTPVVPGVQGDGFVDVNGDKYDLFTVNGNWRQSSLNRGRFATRGSSQTLGIEASVPGGDLEYYKLSYKGQKFFPLNDDYSFRVRTTLGYGDSYGDTPKLPFFENYYAGGFNSVRGFDQNSLGPRSTNAAGDTSEPDPFGGNLLTQVGADLIFPTPFIQDKNSLQTSLFIDGGNVFDTDCGATQTNCSNFDVDELRFSAGLGVNWYTVIGPMSFSFSKPIKHNDNIDDTKFFQFSIGTSF